MSDNIELKCEYWFMYDAHFYFGFITYIALASTARGFILTPLYEYIID